MIIRVSTVGPHEDRMSRTVTTGQVYKPCHWTQCLSNEFTSVDGEQHCLCSWRSARVVEPRPAAPALPGSGYPGGGTPEGSGEAPSGILFSGKIAAAAKVQCPPLDLTPRSPSLHCKCSAPSRRQTPGPRGSAAPAPRSGCSACPWTRRSSVRRRGARFLEAPRYIPSFLLIKRHILINTDFSAASFIRRSS